MFITLEGPEGSGKTTVSKRIIDILTSRGYEVIYTREPGGSEIAESIRNIILDKKNILMDSKTEVLLFAASRRQHLVEKVLPALKEGKIVICDRFIDSSLAYQGHARGAGIDAVYQVNYYAIEGSMPDLTVYFDVTPEIGLKRINIDKNREVNRLDLEKVDFHNKVREGYLILCDRYPERIKKIDASKTIEEVVEDAMKVIDLKLKEKELCK